MFSRVVCNKLVKCRYCLVMGLYDFTVPVMRLSYRTRDEIKEMREKHDPIINQRNRLIDSGLATAEELKKIDLDIRKMVDEAAATAKADPELPLEELYKSIIIDPPADMMIRGCDYTIREKTSG